MEFRALAHGICKEIWVKGVLVELKIPSEGSIQLLCDSQSVISIAKNSIHHDRTKHVEIDRNFIREKIEGDVVKPVYIPSNLQTADILTKALPKVDLEDLNCKLCMINIYNPT